MLDTIKLITDNFKINKKIENENFGVNQKINFENRPTSQNTELFNCNGVSIYGTNAYLNAPNYNVDIKPIYNSVYFSIHYSIPKLVNGSNYEILGKNEYKQSIEQLEQELFENGIEVNLSNSKVSRVDLTRNAITDYAPQNYYSLFENLKVPYKEMTGFTDGFLYKSTKQELCMYDKHKQMEHNKYELVGVPENVLRCEYRFLSSRTIKDIIKIDTAKNLLNRYDRLYPIYNKYIEKTLFKYPINDSRNIIATKNELLNELSQFVDSNGKLSLQKFIKFNGIEKIINKYGIVLLEQTLKEIGMERSWVYRILNQLKEVNHKLKMKSNNDNCNVNYQDLYNELKSKLLVA